MSKPHAEKRTAIAEDYAKWFCERMNTLPQDYPPELVFNMDETCWRLYEAHRTVLEEKGKETVKLRANRSEKTAFTAFGGITCSGEKLPFSIIAKGKTTRSEMKLGSHPGLVIKHAESGGATKNLIIEYSRWLHTEIASGNPCLLIVDVYPTHRTETVMAAAEECDVELVFVPAGGTSEYQPLDHRIFGELKSRVRAEITKLMIFRGGATIDYNQSVSILMRCWNAIPGENIRKVWGLFGQEPHLASE
jgi:hypothetical protein